MANEWGWQKDVRTALGWRQFAAGWGRFGPSEGLLHCLCAARIPGMSPLGTVSWGIKTCLMLITNQNEKFWGGREGRGRGD